VLIPSLEYLLNVFLQVSPDLVQLPAGESVIAGQSDRFQPELADHVLSPHVDVLWFITVETIEKETIGTRNVRNSRHQPFLPSLPSLTEDS